MKQVELVMVSSQNNNKYYRMQENSDGNFTVKYGRVGTSENTVSYPMSQWDKKYKEKIKKGYRDITEFKTILTNSSFKDITDLEVNSLISTLERYSKQSISNNYTISYEQVTQAQIDEAQNILDNIANLLTKKTIVNSIIDEKLTELYTVIPRRMKKVQDFILNGEGNKNKAKAILQREQDAIDTMRGQVALNVVADKQDKTIMDALGITINIVKDSEIINKIKSLMNGEDHQIKNIYEVIKFDTQEKFDKQQKNQLNIGQNFFGTGAEMKIG
jgi:poly [ADP-ribose] polymerase